MNHCPNCGLDLKGIQEAIDKEMQIWRPYDCDLPEYHTWTAGYFDSDRAYDIRYHPNWEITVS